MRTSPSRSSKGPLTGRRGRGGGGGACHCRAGWPTLLTGARTRPRVGSRPATCSNPRAARWRHAGGWAAQPTSMRCPARAQAQHRAAGRRPVGSSVVGHQLLGQDRTTARPVSAVQGDVVQGRGRRAVNAPPAAARSSSPTSMSSSLNPPCPPLLIPIVSSPPSPSVVDPAAGAGRSSRSTLVVVRSTNPLSRQVEALAPFLPPFTLADAPPSPVVPRQGPRRRPGLARTVKLRTPG